MDIELGGTVLCFDAGRTKREQKETAVRNKQNNKDALATKIGSLTGEKPSRGNWKVEQKKSPAIAASGAIG